MFVLDDEVVYSASDLAAAATCEFAFLRRLDEKLGRTPHTDLVDDPMSARLAELGDAHEQRELQRLVAQHGHFDAERRSGVYQVRRARRTQAELLHAKREETLDALHSGADVVFQAAFFDGRFHGYADFLVKQPGVGDGPVYAVHDTKLARHAKVTALLQIAAYADQLVGSGIAVADEGHLLLGDGTLSSHRLADIVPVFRERRSHLQALVDTHRTAGVPVAWGEPGHAACGRCDTCRAAVAEHRDLLLVAGMRISQRKKLMDAGVSSIDDLAAHSGAVDAIPARTLDSLRAQARLQVRQDADGGDVSFDVFDPQRLGCLPPADDGDIFFDFEGDPLWGDAGSAEQGLEYLFGVVETERPRDLVPFWAQDRAEERRALREFIDYVMQRWAKHPGMHIYHYAAYERAALLRLAGRHGVCEAEVDALLRAGVLVDLYAVVREGVRVSQPSYSIKKLEPLYMGDDLRTGDVTTAADSIVSYHRYCAMRDAGRAEEAAAELADIADYNHYDCLSTLRLRDWLLDRADDHGVRLGGAGSDSEQQPEEEPDELAEQLRVAAEPDGASMRTADQQALALLGAALGYNRREDKPFWWTYFDRLRSPVDEWVGTRDCFVAEQVTMTSSWHKEGAQRSFRRHLRCVGELDTGTEITPGTKVHCIYDAPVPDGIECPEGALRGTTTNATVLGVDTDDAGRDVVSVEELLPRDVAQFDSCPIALCGAPGPQTGSIDTAIREVAQQVADDGLRDQPALDLLRRRRPRTGHDDLPPVGDGDGAYIDAITAATADLRTSCLAVQGPPGTGKTFTGARVIARLVSELGWRVGVVAQSHTVVANMLDEVVEAGIDAGQVAKKANGETGQAWRALDKDDHPGFLDAHATTGCVVGGTAWDFTSLKRVQRGQLDLLVIDEGGQFCLANTIAVSVAAQRLLLLGDPQQLPQVSQGLHPEPVDDSALGWLAEGHGALPAERGYFLEHTWRMHPQLCRPVSLMSYEGQLHAQERVTAGRTLADVAPGVQVVEVAHRGNSVESVEEARQVVVQVRGLLGRTWTDAGDPDTPRPLQPRDVLVVAPYNAQVNLLRRLLADADMEGVRVGTVDKFQGQQAPVVIVSMTASAHDDVPRGMSFLLSRNRVNVAVSRGKHTAIIVRSDELTGFLPQSPAALAELGAFVALCSG